MTTSDNALARTADTDVAPINAVLLHTDDNVLIATRRIAQGAIIQCNDEQLIAADTIDIGHKIARHALAAGDKIYRYGAPIGSVTQAIAKGGHVHTHNARSDYIPTHDRTANNHNKGGK